MALAYIEKLDGYIADTPNIDFLRCDGTAFSFYECQSGNFTDTLNFLTVTGGWGTTPLAYIPTDRTTEFQFESAQFSIDIFAMANAVDTKTGDFGALETDNFDVVATTTGEGNSATTTYTITMPFEVMTGSVRIRGLHELAASETAGEGNFSVAITQYAPASGEGQSATAEVPAKTVITFNGPNDVKNGDTVRVTYRRRIVNAVAMDVLSTSSTAKGELAAHYPVYSSGTDCTDASVKGWVHMTVPRVRVTALPSLNGSYKQSATNGLTFAAIDSKRGDKLYYRVVYEPADVNGDHVTETTQTAAMTHSDWGV